MSIPTIVRNPISYISEAFSSAKRDLGGIFSEDLSRPLQQPVARPDLRVAHHSSAGSYVMACLGNEADCKSDDGDEAGGEAMPGQEAPKPETAQFSSLPSHVLACLGNEADCKSDDGDEAGGEAMPGQGAPKPETVSLLSALAGLLAMQVQFLRGALSEPQFSPAMA